MTVSVIVPALRERGNLPELLERVDAVRGRFDAFELILVDDDSGDGTRELVEGLALDWVRLVTRRGERGLSSAVARGLDEARHDVVVVMDADLSHPPEEIPALCDALARPGADFALGSRFVEGGRTVGRGLVRRIASRLAALPARRLAPARDPLSGFFALRRETLRDAAPLDPLGYKIGVELIVKCGCRSIVEVPITFTERRRGRSKLSLAAQAATARHLTRLARYRRSSRSRASTSSQRPRRV